MLVSALLAGDAVERRSRSLFTTSTEKSSLRAPDAIARGKAWGAWMHRSTILQGNQRDNLKHQQRHDAPASQPGPQTDPNQDGSISKPLAISEASPMCSLSGQLRRQLLRRACIVIKVKHNGVQDQHQFIRQDQARCVHTNTKDRHST